MVSNKWAGIKDDMYVSTILSGGGAGGEVCRLRLQLVIIE